MNPLKFLKKPRKLPRLSGWLLITLVLLACVWAIAPQQLPVSLYKLSLVTLAAVVGYWLDRSLFPYARPDVFLALDEPGFDAWAELDPTSIELAATPDETLLRLMGMAMQHLNKLAARYQTRCERRRLALGGLFILAALVWLLVIAVIIGYSQSAHAQSPPNAARYRLELVRAAHSQWGLDAPVAAMAAQVHQESGWNPRAVSGAGAAGMAQFMPATASWWCTLNQLTPQQCQPQNPVWALRSLVGYDKWLWDRVPERYSAYDRLWVALRAYNGGLGHWQAEARVATGTTREAVDAACGRARRAPVHCKENQGYPQRILVQLQPRYAAWGLIV